MKKLSDIEKMMQEQAAKSGQFSFEDGYWNEMNSMLDASDAALNGVEETMKSKSSSQEFEFKPEYWAGMEDTLNSNEVSNSLENAMRAKAGVSAHEFSSDYWGEMEQMLDKNQGTASSVDNKAVKDSSGQSFLYKERYWKEMSAILDRRDRRRKLAVWTTAAAACIVGAGLIASLWNNGPEYNQLRMSGQDSDFEINQLFGFGNSSDRNLVQFTEDHSSYNISNENANENGHSKRTDLGNGNEISNNKLIADNNSSLNQNKVENNIDRIENDNAVGNTDVTNSIVENGYESVEEVNIDRENIDGMSTTTSLSSLNLINIDFAKRKLTTSSIYAQAGVLLANAPEGNTSNRAKLGIGFKGGVGYSFLKKNWGFETGVNFIYRRGINHDLSYNRQLFGTKLWEETDNISYKAVLSLEVPLLAKYQFKRHTIGAGVSGVWNMAAQSTYSKFKSYDDNTEVVNNNYGSMDGINKFDARLQLQYEYQMKSGLSLGLNTHFGLLNQIDRTTISNSQGYRDIGGTIFLKYNFKL